VTKRLRAAEVNWLVKQLEGDREFFAMLPDLDFEVRGRA
jgi:hypothetical protein